ncbi:cytotoxic necrotizing factor [Shewanella baltica]|uniref:cytotoxic necrotizing factor Rho-activating domain-containing protein n=1 Tax=Shewanella baltica TaxID=62322 RepID=UPI00217DCD63|nr:cytotoxic necrotizing factor Rho-activating domain-containing protein [Shewanella baltica]MCS6260593.1 cytotoxic necrotizing factor [Shewanella baltica]
MPMHIFSKANSYDLLTPNLKNSDNVSPIQLVSVRPLTEQERKNLTKKNQTYSNFTKNNKSIKSANGLTKIKSLFDNSSGKNKIVSKRGLPIVVERDSTEVAKAQWKNDPRRNHFKSAELSLQSLLDKEAVLQGQLSPLIGKGIIDCHEKYEYLPFPITHIQNDKNGMYVSSDTLESKTGLIYYTGDNIVPEELIPGSPFGQYFHQAVFDSNLHILAVDNGNKGTVGISFDLNQVKEGQPILIHAGSLSGCSVVFATKSSKLFAFHAGQNNNENNDWITGEKGAESIAQSAGFLANDTSNTLPCTNNQELVSYLSSHFEQSAFIYCGHGDSVVSQSNVNCFDYDMGPKRDEARVGNAMALVSNNKGKISVNVLGDDLSIDSGSFETRSLQNSTFALFTDKEFSR